MEGRSAVVPRPVCRSRPPGRTEEGDRESTAAAERSQGKEEVHQCVLLLVGFYLGQIGPLRNEQASRPQHIRLIPD